MVSLFFNLVSSFGNKKIIWLYYLIIYKHSVRMRYLKIVSWNTNAFCCIWKGNNRIISLCIHRIRKCLGHLQCHCNKQAEVLEKVCHRINPITLKIWIKLDKLDLQKDPLFVKLYHHYIISDFSPRLCVYSASSFWKRIKRNVSLGDVLFESKNFSRAWQM